MWQPQVSYQLRQAMARQSPWRPSWTLGPCPRRHPRHLPPAHDSDTRRCLRQLRDTARGPGPSMSWAGRRCMAQGLARCATPVRIRRPEPGQGVDAAPCSPRSVCTACAPPQSWHARPTSVRRHERPAGKGRDLRLGPVARGSTPHFVRVTSRRRSCPEHEDAPPSARRRMAGRLTRDAVRSREILMPCQLAFRSLPPRPRPHWRGPSRALLWAVPRPWTQKTCRRHPRPWCHR